MASRIIEVILKGVDQTKQAFRSVTDNMQRFGSAIGAVATKLGAAFGVGAGSAVAGVTALANELTRVANIANRLNISTEALSKLTFAARQTGVEASVLEDVLQNMVIRIGEATEGAGEGYDAFRRLGLEVGDLINLAPEEQFKLIADSLRTVANNAERVQLVDQLFGDNGVEALNLLSLGSERIEELGEELEELGGVIDSEAAAAAARFNQQVSIMQARMSALGVSMANDVIPYLTFFASWANGNSMAEAFADAEGYLSNLPPKLRELEIEMRELQGRIEELQQGGTLFTFLLSEGEEQRLLTELRSRLAEVQSLWFAENKRITDGLRQEGERRNEQQKTLTDQLNEYWRGGLATRAKTYEDHVRELDAIRAEEQALLEKIANAGKEAVEGAEAVALGDELDPTDLFLRYQDGLRQLGAGDTAAAQQTIENIVDAMNKLTESGELNILTARNLRGNLSDLATKIAEVRGEQVIEDAEGVQIIDVAKVGEDAAQVRDIIQSELDKVTFKLRWEDGTLADAKAQASEAVSNIPATVNPNVDALKLPVQTELDESSVEETKAAAQQALTGVTAEVEMIPGVGPVAGGYVPTLGEHGEPVYGDASAAEGHKL